MSDQEQQIDRYLQGLMRAGERADFEERLREDSVLAKEIEAERHSRSLVQMAGRNHLKSRLEQIDQQMEKPRKRRIDLGARWWVLAATVLMLFIAGYALLNWETTSSEEVLFAEYFSPYRGPINVRGPEAKEQKTWDQVIESYQAKAYEKAIPLLQSLLSEGDGDQYLVHFYLGICQLAKSPADNEAAVRAFEEVIASPNAYQQQARWYKSLALFREGKLTEARALLQFIIREGHHKSKEAQEILKHISQSK